MQGREETDLNWGPTKGKNPGNHTRLSTEILFNKDDKELDKLSPELKLALKFLTL